MQFLAKKTPDAETASGAAISVNRELKLCEILNGSDHLAGVGVLVVVP